ncbi:cation:proton antiporter [Clostridium sp. cel8]|uniref:cation:proton antiporter n=1 Tax=Clostridium sp. cel8 TaxID=2663123 RepID=UPI0015F363A3|nr:cation:proton antiporter [Clostridium sp. cel8]MBA5850390.1 cation:proton antiporter [Clostridium sp. cel8]
MEEAINFQSILIISLLAFVTPLIINFIKRVNIPFVVGEIFVGIIVGKTFLNVVHEDIWILFLSNLGLAYLMFLSGLEIDFSQFSSKKDNKTVKQLVICIFMFIISLVISYFLSIFLVKLNIITNIYFSTFMLTATAPGLLLPVLKERNLLNSDYGQTLLIFSLICEFLCLISITILSTFVDSGLSYKNFLFTILLLVAFLIYMFIKRALPRLPLMAENFSGLHIEVRAAFALIIILVSVSQALDTEIVMGSFLAGVIFSLISVHNREYLKEKLDIIGYGFLTPIFFIDLGVNLNLKPIFNDLKTLAMIPVLLIVLYIVKFVSSLLLYKLFGCNKTISAGFILSSQLSLMIVASNIAYELDVLSDATYSLFIITTIISCFIFPLLFDKILKIDETIVNKSSGIDKICIHESILSNPDLFNKSIKDIEFPPNCRIFLVVRDSKEIIPDGNTVLKESDILVLGGIKSNQRDMIALITNQNR